MSKNNFREMNKLDFLSKYIELLYECNMVDKVVDLEFAKSIYCAKDSTPFWNFAFVKKNLENKEIQKTEDLFFSHKRNSTFYLLNDNRFISLIKSLKQKGYKIFFEDSWMFYNQNNVDNKNFEKVLKVKTKKQLEIFLATFNKSYRKDDPNNPYGEVGEYLDLVKKTWNQKRGQGIFECFICYKGKKPVSVSSLTNYKGIGYISNVGSLMEVRGQGFGKLATFYCVSESMKKKNDITCLATEQGTFPFDFYQRIGFDNKFSALAMSKKINHNV